MNLANKITIFRILLTPLFISFVMYSKWTAALLVFIVAAISDGVDGYIARRWSQRTEIGKVLDPIADKLLILSAFICLSVVDQLPTLVKPPSYVAIVIISRDAIIVLGVVLGYLIKGTMSVKPTIISKVTTFLQMATVASILIGLAASPILWNITVLFTLVSGFDYVIKGSKFFNEK